MQDRVRGINRTIEESDNNTNNNKTRLVSLVTSADLDRCCKFIDKVREDRYDRVKARQVRKFDILCSKSKHYEANNNNSQNGLSQGANANRQGGSNNNRLDNNNSNNSQLQDKNNNKWIINLSSISLTEAQKSVLAKGPNYSITPKYIQNVEYITAVESMCSKLKEEEAMELRSDVNCALKESQGTQTQPYQAGKHRTSSAQKG